MRLVLAGATLGGCHKGHRCCGSVSSAGTAAVMYSSSRDPPGPLPAGSARCQDRGCGSVLGEEFCEAVVVPEVKIAFGAIRRCQTPWVLTTGLLLGLHNFLALLMFCLVLATYQHSRDRRGLGQGPASTLLCFAHPCAVLQGWWVTAELILPL